MRKFIALIAILSCASLTLAQSFTCPSVDEFQQKYIHHKDGDIINIDGINFTLSGQFRKIPPTGDILNYYGSLIRGPIPGISTQYSFDCAYQSLSGQYYYDMIETGTEMQPVARSNWATAVPNGLFCGFGNSTETCSVTPV